MSNAVQLIKQGIEDVNWNLICKAYYSLTGEILQAPITQETNNDAWRQACVNIKAIINAVENSSVELAEEVLADRNRA